MGNQCTPANLAANSTIPAAFKTAHARIRTLQYLTLAWMLIECTVALISAWRARSVSLLAFGSDSIVEVISATVVLLQIAPAAWRITEARAARLCGTLLYLLAAVVTALSITGLARRIQPETSLTGILITNGALIFMPTLAAFKRKEATRTGNKALRADAAQSATCAYLAAVTLASLLLRQWLHWWWLDATAALGALPFLILEARQARQGKTCACC